MSTDAKKPIKVETITVPLSVYHRMQLRLAFLDALEAAGVDNWEGFYHAQSIFRGEHGEDEE